MTLDLNANSLIPIPSHPDGLNLGYFTLWLFDHNPVQQPNSYGKLGRFGHK